LAIEIHDEYNIKEKIISTLEQNNFSIDQSGEYLIAINKEEVNVFR